MMSNTPTSAIRRRSLASGHRHATPQLLQANPDADTVNYALSINVFDKGLDPFCVVGSGVASSATLWQMPLLDRPIMVSRLHYVNDLLSSDSI